MSRTLRRLFDVGGGHRGCHLNHKWSHHRPKFCAKRVSFLAKANSREGREKDLNFGVSWRKGYLFPVMPLNHQWSHYWAKFCSKRVYICLHQGCGQLFGYPFFFLFFFLIAGHWYGLPFSLLACQSVVWVNNRVSGQWWQNVMVYKWHPWGENYLAWETKNITGSSIFNVSFKLNMETKMKGKKKKSENKVTPILEVHTKKCPIWGIPHRMTHFFYEILHRMPLFSFSGGTYPSLSYSSVPWPLPNVGEDSPVWVLLSKSRKLRNVLTCKFQCFIN